MNEHQARTILARVRDVWGASVDELIGETDEELAEHLENNPIYGITSVDLERAVRLARVEQWDLGFPA